MATTMATNVKPESQVVGKFRLRMQRRQQSAPRLGFYQKKHPPRVIMRRRGRRRRQLEDRMMVLLHAKHFFFMPIRCLCHVKTLTCENPSAHPLNHDYPLLPRPHVLTTSLIELPQVSPFRLPTLPQFNRLQHLLPHRLLH
jgi:hypothetical protein